MVVEIAEEEKATKGRTVPFCRRRLRLCDRAAVRTRPVARQGKGKLSAIARP